MKGNAEKLVVAQHKPWYVEQTLEGNRDDALDVEVVLIRAPAAVGKTTLAEELSAATGAPLLDLGTVRVATYSLQGILGANISQDAPNQFLVGNIPVIVDGLDESPLLSGGHNFDAFLETTWSFISSDRSSTGKVKLIMLGRGSNWELIKASIPDEIRHTTFELGYFDYRAACAVVHKYVKHKADDHSLYRNNHDATQKVIDDYFEVISMALNLSEVELWTTAQGKEMAGYAPVLVALAELLCKSKESYLDLRGRYAAMAKSASAWDVIEDVLGDVVDRERWKLCRYLAAQLECDPETLPASVYDSDEQHRVLIDWVQSQQPTWKGISGLDEDSTVEYRKQVLRWLPEHPFIREYKFSSAVFAAKVLAKSIGSIELGQAAGRRLLRAASRQPFLWRSFRTLLRSNPDLMIDGQWLGYLIASRSTDPVDSATPIEIYQDRDGIDYVEFYSGGTGYASVQVVPPIGLYGTIEFCEVRTRSDLEIQGYEQDGTDGTVFMSNVRLVGERVHISANKVILNGEIHLEAAQVESTRLDEPEMVDEVHLVVAGMFAAIHPWGTYGRPPEEDQEESSEREPGELVRFLEWLDSSWPIGGLVLKADYSYPTEYITGIEREFGRSTSKKVFRLLVKNDLADTDTLESRGGRKVRIKSKVTLADIALAYASEGSEDERIQGFLTDASRLFGFRFGDTAD